MWDLMDSLENWKNLKEESECLTKFSGPVTDVAGEIIEVGQGVKNFKAGDKVVALLSHLVSTQSQSS